MLKETKAKHVTRETKYKWKELLDDSISGISSDLYQCEKFHPNIIKMRDDIQQLQKIKEDPAQRHDLRQWMYWPIVKKTAHARQNLVE